MPPFTVAGLDGQPGFNGGSFGVAKPAGGGSPLLNLPFTSNGSLLVPTVSTDLWLVGDDVVVGQDWLPHGSTSITATHQGSITAGVESPLYPQGGFSGSGFRKAISFNGVANYYTIPSSISNIVTTSTDFSLEFVFRTGTLATTDMIFATAGAATEIAGFYVFVNATILRFYINDSAGAGAAYLALNSSALAPFSWYHAVITWVGSTHTATIYANGVNVGSSSTLSGTASIAGGVAQATNIGTNFNHAGSPFTGLLVECMRHNGLALSSATVLQRYQTFAGLQDTKGTYPSTYTRASAATTVVNGKLWSFGAGWPRIDAGGYYAEGSPTNLLKDSTFTQATLSTNWTVTALVGTTVAYDSVDANIFTNVGGKAVKIVTDGIGSAGNISQTLTTVVSTTYTLSVDHKEPGGGTLYYKVFNPTTGNYLKSDGTWNASVTSVAFSARVSIARDSATFQSEASGTSLQVVLGNAANVLDDNDTIYIYHAQFEANNYASSRIITAAATAARSSDTLQYPSGGYAVGAGSATLTFTPDWTTNFPGSSADILYTSGNAGRMLYTNNNGHLRAFDGTTIAEIAATLTAGVARNYKTKWGASGLIVTDTTGGASNTVAFDGTMGAVGVTQVGTSGSPACGHIQNLIIKSQ